MGSFSWLKADIRNMKHDSSIVNIAYGKGFKFLIPKEFGGGFIKDYSYQDYGYLGYKEDGSPKYDMYELLAIFNVDSVREQETNIMKEIDDRTEDLREIGIEISFSGKVLKYPLKLVSLSYKGTYEDLEHSSLNCPEQGCPLTKYEFYQRYTDLYNEIFDSGEREKKISDFLLKHNLNDFDLKNLKRFEDYRRSGVGNVQEYFVVMRKYNVNGGERLMKKIMDDNFYLEYLTLLTEI